MTRSTRGSKSWSFSVAVAAACASLTCGGDDGPTGTRALHGVVYTTGPVAGARVTVRSLFNDFTFCQGVVTDADGRFDCPIQEGDFGDWYVVAEGGAGLPAGTMLRGGALDMAVREDRTITVSPISDLAVALADARRAAGKDPDAVAAYHTAATLFDAHWDTHPFNAHVKDLAAPTSLDDDAKLTLAIHGLATLASQAAVEQGVAADALTQLQLLALLRQDVAAAGEVFDGESGTLRLGTCRDELFLCKVGADSLRGYLGGAVLAFARTPDNGTGLDRADLLAWLERIRTNSEARLFGAAPVVAFDPLAPTVAWATPTAGQTFTLGQSIMIDVSAIDAGGVASLTVVAAGTAATITDTDPSPERFVATLPLTGLPEGPLTLTATAVDVDGNETSADRSVVIDQVSGGTVSGTVTKGRVSGATITAYRFANGVRGAAVGTTTTDATGNFTNLMIADGTAGPLLLEATGGSYAEDAQPATSVTMDVADRLRTVLPAYTDGAALSSVQLTPLTELAAAYLDYLVGQSLGGADLAARWATAHGAIEAHFGVANIRDVAPVAPAMISSLAAGQRYGLILLGISRTAWRASSLGGGDAGAFGSAVNGYSVTRAWARDLGDGCWDGKAGATTLTYGGVAPITGEAARLNLAQAIVDYLGDGARNQTAFTTAADVLPLLDTIALAATSAPGGCPGGSLFATPGRSFDREPPVITFTTPADGAYLRGTFEVFASAVDNLDTISDVTFVTAGLVDDNVDPDKVHEDVISTSLPDGPFAITVRAVDDSGNSGNATRNVVIDNTAPVIAITAPAADGGFYRGPLTLAWTVTEANPQSVTATLDGAATAPGSQVATEGAHTLVITATDRAGAVTTATRTFYLDNTPPVITAVSSPVGPVVRPPFTITATATDNLQGNGSLGSAITATGTPAPPAGTPGSPADGSRTLALSYTSAADGPLSATFNLSDRAGNAAAPRTVNLTVDQTPPTLTWATAGLTLLTGTYWTATATTALSGTFVDANIGTVVASWPGGSATATLAGASWSIASVPVPAAGHTVTVRATDLAGNFVEQSRTLRSDTTPPVVDVMTTTVIDESMDVVTFSTGTSTAYVGPTRDPNHNHGGTAITLGAATSCTTVPMVKKYAYLLDEVRPHVAEASGPGPGGSNPIRYAIAPTDDGVGITTVQYRVVSGASTLLDWTTLPGVAAQTVPLYRAGATAPSIPGLGTTSPTDVVRFETRAIDALGRTGAATARCWSQTLYAAPIEMGETIATAATNGPAGSGKWALNLLRLEDQIFPIDPVSMMLNNTDGPAGAGLFEFSVWNPTNETVYLSVDLDTPAPTMPATWSKSFYTNKWVYRQTTVNTNCTLAGSCAFDPDFGQIICQIDDTLPGCGAPAPLGTSNSALQTAGATTIPSGDFDIRIWRQDPVSGTFSELTQCTGCSTTPASGTRRVSVALPPRGAGDVPPIRYWVMPVLRPNNDMAPAPGTAVSEPFVAGQYLTGNVMQTTTGCTHFDQRGSAGVYCDTRRDYWKVNYLKSISVQNVGSRNVSLFSSVTNSGVATPPVHLTPPDRVRGFASLGASWTTSDLESLPSP